MKMKEIHFQAGELFGLGEDGTVYIYRPAREPFAAQEPIPYDAQKPCEDRRMTIQELYESNQCQSGQALGSINCDPRYEWRASAEPINIDLDRMLAAKQCAVAISSVAGYRAKFYDGCTAGWEPLAMGISKVVPHPHDPTKAERS